MEPFYTLLAAAISAIATLGSVWIGRKIKCRAKDDTVVTETIQNGNVYTALGFLLNESKADRAYVMEFHNGQYYFSGRGQQKFSCTYETVNQGISAEFKNSQNHRISNFHHYINELINDGHFEHSQTEDIKDLAFKNMIESKGVKSVFNVPLKTLNGKIIGILGIDYVRSSNQFSEKDLSFMRNQARIVAGYLR